MSRALYSFLIVATVLGACRPVASSTPAPSVTVAPALPADTVTPQASPQTQVTADTPLVCPPVEGAVLNQMRAIEGQVSQLRGLQALRAVDRTLFTADQLRAKVVDEFLADYSVQDAAADASLYFLLGLVPEDLDLHRLYTDLLSEQVAGFYDTEAEQMVIVCEGGFGGIERLTYAHEYVHTLQDQRYDFETGLSYSDAACEDSSQRCAATRALFEGDAALLQEQWLRTFASEQDFEDLQLFFSTFAMPVYDSAPAYIRAEFTFPYLEGLFFVRSLYLKDSWEAVDEALLNPPQSTEQILHPERYPRDAVVFLEPAELSGLKENGWEFALEDVLGEWVLLKMLEAYLPADESWTAAGGWGGDYVVLLDNPTLDEHAVIFLVQWDSMRDAHEFTAAFKRYGELRFGQPDLSTSTSAEWTGGEIAGLVQRQSNQTLVILTTSPANLPALRTEVLLPARALP